MGKIAEYVEKRTGLSSNDRRLWREIFGGKATAAGVSVNESNALQSVAVYACVRILAETVASLPLPVYRRLTPRGKERAYSHPLYSLLHDNPNPEMSSFSFREALQGHLALRGNAYAEIDWDIRTGRIRGLWPLRPDRMRVERKDGRLWYIYQLPDSVRNEQGGEVVFPSYRIWHIPGMGYDGIIGYSPIKMAREAIGLAMATEEYGARFFGNGARPGGALKHPKTLTPDAETRLRTSWNEIHQGLSNQHRLAILEEGMEYQQIGISPEDSQFLETRKFQRGEIASFFHIPPHMIGDLERATFSNIEHQSIEFAVYTMRPWFVRWEQSINLKLLTPDERKDYFAEFLVDGLLRGDINTRYQAYATAKQWGWMSSDDIRELENQNPLPDGQGQVYYIPMNMMPADMIKQGEGEEGLGEQFRKVRSSRSALQRFRTARNYERVFNEAARQIVEREKNNVLRAARKHLKERAAIDFNAWLDDFYRDFPEFIGKKIGPAIWGLGEAIQPLAAEEVNSQSEMTPELEKFLDNYRSAFNYRYTESSREQLKAIMREAAEKDEDALEAIETRLDEWEQKRPDKVAKNETVQLSNAIAKLVFAGAGVTKLRWVAMGSKSCPICQQMDGKVVGIEQNFVEADDVLEGDGQNDMKVYRPAAHAPLHQGCVCQIVPE